MKLAGVKCALALWLWGSRWTKKRYARLSKELFLLGGVPGAGKGTNTGFIMNARGLTCDPIVVRFFGAWRFVGSPPPDKAVWGRPSDVFYLCGET